MSNIITIWLVAGALLFGGWLGHVIENYIHSEGIRAAKTSIGAFSFVGGLIGAAGMFLFCFFFLR